MKADWDRLGAKWNKGGSVLIIDVDCTAGGQSTCQQQGVQGYPTIKYYKDGKTTGSAYQGGRDFNSLDSFVKRTLDVAKCDVATKKNCKKNELKFIKENEGKSTNELEDMLAQRSDALKTKKKELRELEKAFREKEKEFKKEEKRFQLSSALLKGLIKQVKSSGKTEL